MAAFAFDFSRFWLDRRAVEPPREPESKPAAEPVDADDQLLRELVERVNAARTIV